MQAQSGQQELKMAKAQIASQLGQLARLALKAELHSYSAAAQAQAAQIAQRKCREREAEIVALRLRLYRLKQNPAALDLASDPCLERDVRDIVRDAHVRHLEQQRAELLQQLGQQMATAAAR